MKRTPFPITNTLEQLATERASAFNSRLCVGMDVVLIDGATARHDQIVGPARAVGRTARVLLAHAGAVEIQRVYGITPRHTPRGLRVRLLWLGLGVVLALSVLSAAGQFAVVATQQLPAREVPHGTA